MEDDCDSFGFCYDSGRFGNSGQSSWKNSSVVPNSPARGELNRFLRMTKAAIAKRTCADWTEVLKKIGPDDRILLNLLRRVSCSLTLKQVSLLSTSLEFCPLRNQKEV
jgi:hypothetical protein